MQTLCSHVQSCKLVHESGVHCHVCAFSTDVPLCTSQSCVEHSSEGESVNHSVISDSSWPHELEPSSCFCHRIPWARILEWVAIPSPRDLPNPGIKLCLLCLPHCRQVLYRLSHQGSQYLYLKARICAINVSEWNHRHGGNRSLPSDSCCWRSSSSIISPSLPLPAGDSSCLFTRCQPLCVSRGTVL